MECIILECESGMSRTHRSATYKEGNTAASSFTDLKLFIDYDIMVVKRNCLLQQQTVSSITVVFR
jgi:hypothetical protein